MLQERPRCRSGRDYAAAAFATRLTPRRHEGGPVNARGAADLPELARHRQETPPYNPLETQTDTETRGGLDWRELRVMNFDWTVCGPLDLSLHTRRRAARPRPQAPR
eukprot:scaffold79311_cov59-Phaeocystis_antarctica.AAC.2